MFGYLGENGPKCEKDVKKQKTTNPLFPLCDICCIFQKKTS